MMLLFRAICAASLMLGFYVAHLIDPGTEQQLRYMPTIALVTAGMVGFGNLATRQGWGLIVAVVNGLWAGLATIVLASVAFVAVHMVAELYAIGGVTFPVFLETFDATIADLLGQAYEVRNLLVHLVICVAVGVVTEIVHWLLVHVRHARAARRTRQEIEF